MFHCKPCSGGFSTLLSGVVIAAIAAAGAYTLRGASASPDAPASMKVPGGRDVSKEYESKTN